MIALRAPHLGSAIVTFAVVLIAGIGRGGEAVAPAADAATPPWKVNTPIAAVTKESYKRHERPRQAALVSVTSVGPKLELREVHAYESQSDVGDDIRARWSTDNGRTWSEFVPVQPSNNVNYAGVTVWEGEGPAAYDPADWATADNYRYTVTLNN